MGSEWPLAFLGFFVVIAFALIYLAVDRLAKRVAERPRKPAAPDDRVKPPGARGT